MATLASLVGDLTGTIPKLPSLLALKHINRAYSQIRDKRLWSFLIGETGVFFPDVLPSPAASGSTVSVTYGSASVVGTAAAAADWTTQIIGPPVPLIQRQFRVGSGGPIYNITAISTTVNANDTLTLDQPYGEVTNATATFSIYRAYAAAPTARFKRWQSVYDPNNGYPLVPNIPRTLIDRVDPTRGAMGQAYRVVNYKTDPTTNIPIFEFWPHQTTQNTFRALYEIRGSDLALGDSLPPQIPDDLVIDWSLAYFSYPWANSNVGRFPELRGTNWLALAIESKASVFGRPGQVGKLADAMRNDEETFQQRLTFLRKTYGLYYPISGKFEQEHSSWSW